MGKKIAIFNDELGTIALGFSKSGYEVGAIYLDHNNKNAIKVCQQNWSELTCAVDWNDYPISAIIDADFIAGEIQFKTYRVKVERKREENSSQYLLKIVEILLFKRPSAFLFRYDKVSNENESFRYFCEEVEKAGYQIQFNTIDINYLTGLPVNEKENFIYGSLDLIGFNLDLIKETYGINYSVDDICEKSHVEDEWYYNVNTRYRNNTEQKNFHTFLCWKDRHYVESKCVRWNYRMIPLVAYYDEIRKLTHREIARLKGIPDEYFLEINDKSWFYQKLMFCTNVLAIQQIASAFNYGYGKRTFESREVKKGLEFENIMKTYFENKKVTMVISDSDTDNTVDFRFTINSVTFSVVLKIFSGNVGIENSILAACSRFFTNKSSDNEKNILIVGNIVGDRIKLIAKNNFHVDIWDVENLLWLFDEYPQIKSDFISLLSFTVGNIEPKEPELVVFKQQSQKLYNIELQEKLRKIKPGKQDAYNFEKLCAEILRYIFSEDLEFIGEQKRSNDGLYRFDYCCKIKHGELKEFFDTIQKFFNTKYIIFEFKNHEEQITQKDIHTTEKYLYEKALRKVAIIISRKGADMNAQKAARGCLRENGKLIICLSDEEIIKLIDIKSKSGIPGDMLEVILDDMLMELEK